MRTLEVIEKDLGEAKEALTHVQGRTAEVYSRIVGYYRSVRNWNKGKREEFGERKLFDPAAGCGEPSGQPREGLVMLNPDARPAGGHQGAEFCADCAVPPVQNGQADTVTVESGADGERLVLFVRQGCPTCPDAKEEAGKLGSEYGLSVEMVNADTEQGIEKAQQLGVLATPTAILFSPKGEEITRARDRKGIARMGSYLDKKSA
jgi:ribonucleoside-triphosphate reductase